MSRLTTRVRARGRWSRLSVVVAVTGVGAAALAGVTSATTFTLQIAKHAPVTNQAHHTIHENIVVNSVGKAVYTLSGDSKTHPECTKANSCFMFWPPVTVKSLSQLKKQPGIQGKLGIWRRNGLMQVTLNGHPLYTYSADIKPRDATGQGVKAFNGTWGVRRPRITTSAGGGGW